MITTPEQMREAVACAMWKAESERATPNVARMRTADAFATENENMRQKWLSLADAAIRAIPIAPQPVAVTVKPLTWDHVSIYGWVFARGGILSYAIMLSVNRVYGVPGPNDGAAQFETIELAKAAAQADYEARILSTLTIQPADPLSDPRVKALVEAARDMRDYGTCLAEQKYHRNLDAALRAIGGEA